MKPGWFRYRVRDKCGVCSHGGRAGHNSGCIYYGELSEPYVIGCRRVREGSFKDMINGGGWLHRMRECLNRIPDPPPVPQNAEPPRWLGDLALQCYKFLCDEALEMLADTLGVTANSLRRLRVGWCESYLDMETGEDVTASAFTFPMRACGNLVVGIRLRDGLGRKWAVRGSKNGIFVPTGIAKDGPLWIVEGPTDTAAMLDLGFPAIGRPSNTAGQDYLVDYCKRFLPRRPVYILHNNDPAGSDAMKLTLLGAHSLAKQLQDEKAAGEVRVMMTKTKDVRDAVRQGAVHDDIENLSFEMAA